MVKALHCFTQRQHRPQRAASMPGQHARRRGNSHEYCYKWGTEWNAVRLLQQLMHEAVGVGDLSRAVSSHADGGSDVGSSASSEGSEGAVSTATGGGKSSHSLCSPINELACQAGHLHYTNHLPLDGEWAAELPALHHIELLLARGADVNMPCTHGCTPLVAVMQQTNTVPRDCDGLPEHCALHVVQALLARGANARACCPHNGCTALHMACRCVKLHIARALLAAGAEPSARDCSGATRLHRAAAWAGASECFRDEHVVAVIELLLAHGADASMADGRGDTSLHMVVGRSHLAARALLAAGAATDAVNALGETPLARLLALAADYPEHEDGRALYEVMDSLQALFAAGARIADVDIEVSSLPQTVRAALAPGAQQELRQAAAAQQELSEELCQAREQLAMLGSLQQLSVEVAGAMAQVAAQRQQLAAQQQKLAAARQGLEVAQRELAAAAARAGQQVGEGRRGVHLNPKSSTT